MFNVFLLGSLVTFLLGCNTSQQKITYNTLFSVEKVTTGAFDGYVSEVVKGNITTNGLPIVANKFNQFQNSFLLILDAARYNTNAIAPQSLVVESQDIINLISNLKGVK